MILCFRIPYVTRWGEQLKVCGSLPELGDWDAGKAPALTWKPGGVWELVLDIPAPKGLTFEYKFVLTSDAGAEWEWGGNRRQQLPAKVRRANLFDYWRPGDAMQNAWFSSAFTKVLMRRPAAAKSKAQTAGAFHRFQMAAPRVGSRLQLCIVGSDPALGAWDEAKAVPMQDAQFPVWQADVQLAHPDQPVDYKYAIWDPEKKAVLSWEEGENRRILPRPSGEGESAVVISDEGFHYPIGNWKGAGVAVPVFSLRSRQSGGVGEFSDLKLLIDWAKQTGLKMVQILPINDTIATHSWTDSYPYAAISVFALHPMYLNLAQVGELKDEALRAEFAAKREALNSLDAVDYEAVMQMKSRYIKLAYDQDGRAFLKDLAFQAFFAQNKEWLQPYAAFSALRDRYQTADFSQWPEYSVYEPLAVNWLTDPARKDYDDFAIHYYSQWHLHQQLTDAAAYARSQGVLLKGDIPIGIYRHSADAWVAPQLYNMGAQAGAPPDAFAVAGQNWGFPTYNWAEMAKDGYAWWRRRLGHMATYFDAYRIDHILGFFRIWEIPINAVQGLLGHFNPAMPLSRDEVSQALGWFDYDRLCRPYIREYMLDELFGSDKEEVKNRFLETYWPGQYRLLPEFSSQRAVERQLAPAPGASEAQQARLSRLREGLYKLISEVLLIEAPFSEGRAFNPRISLTNTYSFRDLDGRARAALEELYIHYFFRRHEAFWRGQAMSKLPAITRATDMLVCGEDLGMVPDCVPGVMKETGILSLEIQRMPKAVNREFGHPADAPYLSVVTPSSHDMSTIRGWWEEDRELIQRFYNQMLGHPGEAPIFCEPWIVREILVQHLFSPAMWAVFPIQDLVGMDGKLRSPYTQAEQINVPANPKHYWRYRFHLPMESLLEASEFNAALRGMIEWSGRNADY